jgi:hypothetical protein
MRIQFRLFLAGVVVVTGAVAWAQVSPTQKPAISLTISAAQQTLKAGTVLNVKAALVRFGVFKIRSWRPKQGPDSFEITTSPFQN